MLHMVVFVQAHAEVVERANPQAYMVVMRKVSKVFAKGGWCGSAGGTVAVRDLSIAVPPQHCFGLLGVDRLSLHGCHAASCYANM